MPAKVWWPNLSMSYPMNRKFLCVNRVQIHSLVLCTFNIAKTCCWYLEVPGSLRVSPTGVPTSTFGHWHHWVPYGSKTVWWLILYFCVFFSIWIFACLARDSQINIRVLTLEQVFQNLGQSTPTWKSDDWPWGNNQFSPLTPEANFCEECVISD